MDLPLFRSADYNDFRQGYTAMFNLLNQDEAMQILGALLVFLEARYGDKIWQWFEPHIRNELADTRWDHEKGCLVETGIADRSLFSNLDGRGSLDEWEEHDLGTAPVDSISSFVADLSAIFNMEPLPISEGHDENLSVATMNTGTSNATLVAAAMPPDEVLVIADDSTAEASSLTNGSAPPTGASGRRAGVASGNG